MNHINTIANSVCFWCCCIFTMLRNPHCAIQVFDTARCSKAYSGNVVLSTGASLSWLAFSREGLLAAMDTSRVLRVRSPDWGGSWVPVLDAVGAKARAGAEQYWPTWLDTSTCMAVVTSSKVPHPQVCSRPCYVVLYHSDHEKHIALAPLFPVSSNVGPIVPFLARQKSQEASIILACLMSGDSACSLVLLHSVPASNSIYHV